MRRGCNAIKAGGSTPLSLSETFLVLALKFQGPGHSCSPGSVSYPSKGEAAKPVGRLLPSSRERGWWLGLGW